MAVKPRKVYKPSKPLAELATPIDCFETVRPANEAVLELGQNRRCQVIT
jgi:hypothetical protein